MNPIRTMVVVTLLCAASGCAGEERRYQLHGQIVGVESSRNEVTVKHDAVPNLMDGMTMPFRVEPVTLLQDRRPGDLISATLVVRDGNAYLTDLKKTGFSEPNAAPAASSGFELLSPGDEVPDPSFTSQDGRPFKLSDGRGKAVALTFIYTRCPIPTFCPAIDRQFAAVQKIVAQDPDLRGRVQLVSITFDPAHDTPQVLKAHAGKVGADPNLWTFLTGDRDEIDRFLSRFGGTATRDPDAPSEIAHNLRTAVIDPRGRLVKIHSGVEWLPQTVVADLKTALKPS